MTARGPRRRKRKGESRGRPYQRLVAEVVQTFDPGAKVEEGIWVQGPDGRLDMDVSIRGTVDSKEVLTLIECKDFAPGGTGPVGRHFVDALDSKRQDLRADFAILCSNAGFTRDALSKARRKGIGMISVLRAGDTRVKCVIEHELIHCRIRFTHWTFTHHSTDNDFHRLAPELHQLRFDGFSLDSWLQHRATLIAGNNPEFGKEVLADFRFVEPVQFTSPIGPITLSGAAVAFRYETEWLSQIVQMDASTGIYDYLRGHLRIAPGKNSFQFKGVNFDAAKPIPRPADWDYLRTPLQPGEMKLVMVMHEGLNNEGVQSVAPLEPLVRPEDLSTRIEPVSLSAVAKQQNDTTVDS